MRKLISSIFLSSLFFAVSSKEGEQVNPLFKCLGREEARFHKSKVLSPEYYLNQELISLVINYDNLLLSPKAFREVCGSRDSVSIALLKELIFSPEDLFGSSIRPDLTANDRKTALTAINSEAPEILNRYLFRLQEHAKTYDCLRSFVPEINAYFNRQAALKGVAPEGYVVDKDNLIKNIFKRLNRINTIYKDCEEISEQRSKKARLNQK